MRSEWPLNQRWVTPFMRTSVEMFRRKLRGTLLLSIPTLVWAPMMQHWFGYTPLAGPPRRGRRRGVPVSAIVDTDDTVMTFLTPSPSDMLDTVLSETAEGGLLELAEATAYLAGTRSAYVSVLLPVDVDEEVWGPRIRRRAERIGRVLSSSARSPENLRAIGGTTWSALYELLSEIAQSRFVSTSEQRFATTTAAWMCERLKIDRNHQRLA